MLLSCFSTAVLGLWHVHAASSVGWAELCEVQDRRGSSLALVDRMQAELLLGWGRHVGSRDLSQRRGKSEHRPWRGERDSLLGAF